MKNRTLKKVLKRGVAYLLSVLVVITMMINPISAKAAPKVTSERVWNVPYLNQNNYTTSIRTNWGDKTVAGAGCNVTCMSMIYKFFYQNSYTHSNLITPEVMFRQAVNLGYYQGNGLSHQNITDLCPKYGMSCGWTDSIDRVVNAIKAGNIVIYNVGKEPDNAPYKYNFTSGGHYIVLSGVREYDNGNVDVFVLDPNKTQYRQVWLPLKGGNDIFTYAKHDATPFGIVSRSGSTFSTTAGMSSVSLTQGQACPLTGTISYTSTNIGEIHAAVYDSNNQTRLATSVYTYDNNIRSYNLRGSQLDNNLRFGTLPAGTYTLHISAFDVTGRNAFKAISFTVIAPGFITFSTTPSMQTTSIRYGSSCNIYGAVSSSHNITSLTGKVYKTSNTKTPYLQASCTPNTKTVNIATSAVNKNLKFGSLPRGSYYLVIEAKNSAGKTISKKIAFSVR